MCSTSKKCRKVLKGGLDQLVYVLVGLQQITEDTAADWEDDAAQYVMDNDPDTLEYSVRIAAQELLCELRDTFKAKTLVALYGAAQRITAEMGQPAAETPPQFLWKRREALLTALSIMGRYQLFIPCRS